MFGGRARLVEELFETGLENGGCFSLISGVPIEVVARAFRALGEPVEDPVDAGEPAIRVHSLPDGALCIVEEFGEDLGAEPSVLGWAARDGRAASLQWTVDFDSSLLLVESGGVRYSSSELDSPYARAAPPDDLNWSFEGLQFEEQWLEDVLIVMERFVGTALPGTAEAVQWLGAYEVAPLPRG